MPRKKKLNRKRYQQEKRLYNALRLEQKIRKLRRERQEITPEPLSAAERRLIEQVEAYRRAERFDALELELVNHERKQVGLLPLQSIPVDPAQMERAIDFERQRGPDPGRIGVRG